MLRIMSINQRVVWPRHQPSAASNLKKHIIANHVLTTIVGGGDDDDDNHDDDDDNHDGADDNDIDGDNDSGCVPVDSSLKSTLSLLS